MNLVTGGQPLGGRGAARSRASGECQQLGELFGGAFEVALNCSGRREAKALLSPLMSKAPHWSQWGALSWWA